MPSRRAIAFAFVSILVVSCTSEHASPPRAQAGKNADAPALTDARKIVYQASMQLAVTDLPAAAERVSKEIASIGGYVASSELSGRPAGYGESRIGRLTLRVPAASFRAAIDSLRALGTLDALSTSSEDKTAEWTDLDARLGAKRVEEKRLLRAIDDRAGTLEEVLKVEAELGRVRGDIESMQGARATLSKLVELSTITLTLIESHPILPAGAPAFAGQLGSTFMGSAGALLDTSKAGLIVAVALVPWTLAALLGFLVVRAVTLFAWRRISRRAARVTR